MSEFSDLLKEYLAVKNKNVIGMARYCSTDKSTMYKFLKASRNPASEDLVRKMAGYLQLTPDEEEHFMEAYRIAQEGKVVYYRRKEVEKFLRAPFTEPGTGTYVKLKKERADDDRIRIFDHPHTAENNLYETILAEMEKEDGHLSLYLTDINERFSLFLTSFLRDHPGVSLDLILMINDDSYEYSRDDSGYLNLKKLRSILPIALQTENRRLFYQYGAVPGAGGLPYFTNIVLTGDTVILLANGYTRSMCIHDPEVCGSYQKIFAETLAVSRKLIVSAGSLEQMFDYLTELSFKKLGAKMIFEMSPCFFQDVTKELLSDKITGDISRRKELIGKILAYTQYNKSVIQNGKVTMIHCFDGYRDFMETGLLRDIPSDMYEPLDLKERIEMLERYISTMGDPDLHVLKEPLGPIENGIYVFLYNNSFMFQFLDHNGKLMIMRLDESSYFEAFEDYLESLVRKKELFYTRTELKKKLNELLDDYKSKYPELSGQ